MKGRIVRIFDRRVVGWVRIPELKSRGKLCLVLLLNGRAISRIKIGYSGKKDNIWWNSAKRQRIRFVLHSKELIKRKDKKNVVISVIEKKSRVHLDNSPVVINQSRSKNKVFIVGLNKSGTSILTYMTAAGLGTQKVYFEPNSKEGLNSVAFHGDVTRYNDIVTKCLYYPDYTQYLKEIGLLYDKKVWIVRDPRDLLISAYSVSYTHLTLPTKRIV